MSKFSDRAFTLTAQEEPEDVFDPALLTGIGDRVLRNLREAALDQDVELQALEERVPTESRFDAEAFKTAMSAPVTIREDLYETREAFKMGTGLANDYSLTVGYNQFRGRPTDNELRKYVTAKYVGSRLLDADDSVSGKLSVMINWNKEAFQSADEINHDYQGAPGLTSESLNTENTTPVDMFDPVPESLNMKDAQIESVHGGEVLETLDPKEDAVDDEITVKTAKDKFPALNESRGNVWNQRIKNQTSNTPHSSPSSIKPNEKFPKLNDSRGAPGQDLTKQYAPTTSQMGEVKKAPPPVVNTAPRTPMQPSMSASQLADILIHEAQGQGQKGRDMLNKVLSVYMLNGGGLALAEQGYANARSLTQAALTNVSQTDQALWQQISQLAVKSKAAPNLAPGRAQQGPQIEQSRFPGTENDAAPEQPYNFPGVDEPDTQAPPAASPQAPLAQDHAGFPGTEPEAPAQKWKPSSVMDRIKNRFPRMSAFSLAAEKITHVEERHEMQPSMKAIFNTMKIANITSNGAYLQLKINWEPSVLENMLPMQIKQALVTYVKGQASMKDRQRDLGTLGKIRVKTLDCSAGLANLECASDMAANFAQSLSTGDDGSYGRYQDARKDIEE